MARFLRYVPLLLGVVSLATAMVPNLLTTNAFRAQSQADVAWSYRLSTWGPLLTVLLLVTGLLLVFRGWRGGTRIDRVAMAAALVPLVAGSIMTRIRTVELMFEPAREPGWVQASAMDRLADTDMVLGVAIGGEARAYPVRIVGYHHIVNDRLAGEPFVVTY